MKNIISLLLLLIGALLSGFAIGINYNHNKVESRALNIDSQECYSDKDIEYIVFGESQL